jgi:hypothetical protein
MSDQLGWTTISAMLGTNEAKLRQAAAPWIDNPMTPKQFVERVAGLNALAGALNNTNLPSSTFSKRRMRPISRSHYRPPDEYA